MDDKPTLGNGVSKLFGRIPDAVKVMIILGAVFGAGGGTSLWLRGQIEAPTVAAGNTKHILQMEARADSQHTELTARIDSLRILRLDDRQELVGQLADLSASIDRLACMIEAGQENRSTIKCR